MTGKSQFRRTLAPAAAAFAALTGASCTSDEQAAPAIAAAPEEAALNQPMSENGVANLPFARGKVFYSLDDYLAHLKEGGAIDLPWWREIRPGVYEHMVRMPGAEREIATREELMQRFGFKR